MPKYKLLNFKELQSLEKEFIDFLVVNGITGDDWVKLKEEDPEKATKMTESFSDVVWESILRKTMYLEHYSMRSIKCFQCLVDKIVLVGMDSETTDLTATDFNSLTPEHYPEDVKVYTTEKPYAKVREQELFDMLNWGCQRSDGSLFKSICLAL